MRPRRRGRPDQADLNLALVRDDLDDPAVAVLEHRLPGLGVRPAAATRPGADGPSDGLQSPHPAATSREAVDNRPGGVQPVHPAPGTGGNRRANGVQPAQARGATVAPEPDEEPSQQPAAPARTAPPAAAAGGGGPAGEFFAALDHDRQLTAAQRARLTPAVTAALHAGWTPPALAGFTGANTGGVRNPYAVLAARLSAAELPPPYPRRPSRPPWCGECDQATRMLGFDGDAPRPCPRCKPSAAASRAADGENRRTW